MSKKPFPFSVCEQCCATGGGTDNEYVNQNFANAVKGTASGRSVFVNDVSPIEHEISVKLTSDTFTDFSNVTVKKHGKNFLEHRFKQGVTETYNGVTITGNNDGSISLNGTATGYFGCNILDDSNPLKLPYGTYTFSHEGELPEGAWMSMVIDIDNGISVITEKPIANVYDDITLCWISANAGTVFDNVVIKPQIETGEIATEYESPYAFESYTPDNNGIIHGLTASSFIKLSTDNDVAVFDVEYNKNITAPNTAELIETIEVTESNLFSIIRTHEPNGTPYDFKAMYIHHEVKPCTIDNTILFGAYDHADAVTFNKSLCRFQVRNTATTSGRFISTHFDVIGGVWTAFGVGTTIQGSPTSVTMERDFKPYKGETIKGIKIQGYTTSLEVGSVFKIYGVRA